MMSSCAPGFHWRSGLRCALLCCLVLAVGCQTPVVPQPAALPGRHTQVRVCIVHVECLRAGPSVIDPRHWWLFLKIQLLGSSADAVKEAAWAMDEPFGELGRSIATVMEREGTHVDIIAPEDLEVHYDPSKPMPLVSPAMPTRPALQPTGDWKCELFATLFVVRRPGAQVELAIDGEALRTGLIESRRLAKDSLIRSGSLTGGTFRVVIPDPQPDAPASSGAGIGQPQRGG